MEEADRETRPEDQTDDDDGRSERRVMVEEIFFFSEELDTNGKMVMDTKSYGNLSLCFHFFFFFRLIFYVYMQYNGYDKQFIFQPLFHYTLLHVFALSLGFEVDSTEYDDILDFQTSFWRNENFFMAIVRKSRGWSKLRWEKKKKGRPEMYE